MGGGVVVKAWIPYGSGCAYDCVELGGIVWGVQAEQAAHGVAG